MSHSTQRQSLVAHLLLLAVVLVWGSTFNLVKSALADATPLIFNLVRMALAAAVLLAINVRTLRGLTRNDLALGAGAGLFLALGYQFQTAGLNHTTPAKSAFLTGLVVVIVPLLSAIPGIAKLGSPRPGVDVYTGAALAFAGLILLTMSNTPGMSFFAELWSGFGLGELLSLLCAIAFAAHLLTLARAAHAVSARRLGTLQIAFAALFMLLTLPLGGQPHFHSSKTLWIALAVTSLLATAVAFTIQSWAQRHIPPSHTAVLFTLEPVFAALISCLYFHERLGTRALAGAALILLGILLAELQPTSRRPAPLLPVGA
jgi:drug/metabolite transporter (DMT)-like permease